MGDEIPTLIQVDPFVDGNKQKNIHTRYHPDIPTVADIELGKPFKIQCLDYSGGQVHNDDCADDVLDLDHDRDHLLSGPLFVPTAEPGDVLEIDILDVKPFDSQQWGYSITSPGLGALDVVDDEPLTTKTIWDFHGCETSSRHVPHVSFHGRPHAGVIATAPSIDLLAEWTHREARLADAQLEARGEAGVLVSLPKTYGAYIGQDLDPGLRYKIYREGARTSPPREHGGNIDIGSLTRGSKLFLPVFVSGGKLSIGDLHFSEGDGEPTTAIEMAGIITLRVNVIHKGIDVLSLQTPMFLTTPSEPVYYPKLVFTGISVDSKLGQRDSCGMTAYRNASFRAMAYLMKFGYSREQAYVILSTAPIEVKIACTANRPNILVTLGVPTGIFDFDILPRALPAAIRTFAGPAQVSSKRLGNGANQVG